jgi:hypothetical protein
LSSSTLSRFRPGCAICSRSFRDGGRDVVCDSNNALCPHVFHARCMRTWLLRNRGCPLCRHEYLLDFNAKWSAAVPAPVPSPPAATAADQSPTAAALAPALGGSAPAPASSPRSPPLIRLDVGAASVSSFAGAAPSPSPGRSREDAESLA